MSYGSRFTFRLAGPFHGVATWRISQDQSDQAEVIASGIYEVTTEERPGTTVVTLRELGPVDVTDQGRARAETVLLGGIYRTDTVIPIESRMFEGGKAAPPGLKVRVIATGPNIPTVEALEDDWVEIGDKFVCPAGNLVPIERQTGKDH